MDRRGDGGGAERPCLRASSLSQHSQHSAPSPASSCLSNRGSHFSPSIHSRSTPSSNPQTEIYMGRRLSCLRVSPRWPPSRLLLWCLRPPPFRPQKRLRSPWRSKNRTLTAAPSRWDEKGEVERDFSCRLPCHGSTRRFVRLSGENSAFVSAQQRRKTRGRNWRPATAPSSCSLSHFTRNIS